MEDAGQAWKKKGRKVKFDPGPPEEIDHGPEQAPSDAEEILEKKPRKKPQQKHKRGRNSGRSEAPPRAKHS